jgi:hypothetical protein
MYFAEKRSNSIILREASGGAYHWEVFLREGFLSFNYSGNILTVSYNDGTDVLDVPNRRRIR